MRHVMTWAEMLLYCSGTIFIFNWSNTARRFTSGWDYICKLIFPCAVTRCRDECCGVCLETLNRLWCTVNQYFLFNDTETWSLCNHKLQETKTITSVSSIVCKLNPFMTMSVSLSFLCFPSPASSHIFLLFVDILMHINDITRWIAGSIGECVIVWIWQKQMSPITVCVLAQRAQGLVVEGPELGIRLGSWATLLAARIKAPINLHPTRK